MIESKLGECVFTRSEIEKRVQEIAAEINQDYLGKRPLIISILRGAIFFTVDLVRSLTIPFDLDFMALSNYKTGFKKVEIEKEGKGMFESSRFVLHPTIDFQNDPGAHIVENLLDKAKRYCIVSKSVKGEVIVEPSVRLN